MDYLDIETPKELYNFMKDNIKYGFVSSKTNKKYSRKELQDDDLYEEILFNEYFLQTPKELLNNKYGICYDQVEFAKKWFVDNSYEVITYYSTFHNHTIIIYIDKFDNTYNLFERTFPKYNNIYKANTLEEIFDIYKDMQFGNAKEDIEEIKLYKYQSVKFGSGFYEYINDAKKSKDTLVLKRSKNEIR